MVKALRNIPRTEDLRERDLWRADQDDDNSDKANRVPNTDEDNIWVSDGVDGDLKDSGIDVNNVVLRDSNQVYPVSDYQVLADDEYIFVKCSSVDIAITLPSSTSRTFTIYKIDDTAFKVLIVGQAGEIINWGITAELLYQGESYVPTKTNKTLSGSDWLI